MHFIDYFVFDLVYITYMLYICSIKITNRMWRQHFNTAKEKMRTPEFYIETKKTGAGHYLVTVTDEANNEIKSYTETDMQVIDAYSEEDGMYDMTQWDATQIMIRKAGFDN